MGDNGAKALGVKLFKETRLSILSLAHNRIGDAGVAVLAKGIATMPSLMVRYHSCLPHCLRVVDCSCRPTSSSGAVGAALSFAVTVLDLS